MEKTELTEEMLAILFQKAPDAIYLNDLKGAFVDGNEQAEIITGYQRNELIGKSFLSLNLLPKTDLPRAATNLGMNLLGQSTGPDEFTLNRKDGSQIRVEIRTYPIKYQGKTIVMGIARDISKRKQVETDLRRERDMLELLLDGLGVTQIGVDIVDLNYTIQYQNQLLMDRFRDGLGKKCYETYLERDTPCEHCSMVDAVHSGSVESIEVQGSDERLYELISAPLANPDGSIDRVIEVVRDITVQKHAQDQQKASEEKYRSFLEASVDGITVNIQGKFVYVNPSFVKLVGYSEEELLNSSILKPVAPEYVEMVKDRSTRRLEGENVVSQYEIELMRKDEARVPIEFNITRVEYEGKPATISFIRDISERKQIELALEKTRSGYQKLIEQASDAIVVTNKEEILYANDALAKLTGYEHAEDIIGLSPDPFYHPDYFKQLDDYTKARQRGDFAPPRYQMKVFNRNGKLIEVDIQVSLIEWQGTTATLGILRDITQQKLFESRREAVYQLSAFLSQATTVEEITEKTLDIINQVMDYEIVTFQTLENNQLWVRDARGVKKYEKPVHVADKGLTAKAVKLKNTINTPDVRVDPSYIQGASTDTISELDVPLISGGSVCGVINVESRRLNAFGKEDEIILELLAQHVASALERVQNAVEKESYERELFMGQLRLEQEQELNQLKTRFMSTATHEIRTPLASIQGYTEIIQDELENLSENQRKYFEVILRNVHRLSVLTDDLLNLQRLEEGRLSILIEDVDLTDFKDDVMNEFNPFLKAKNQVVHCNCLDATVKMDRLRVIQVVVNLLSNATKFSPAGGEITFDARKVGDNIQFTISDNGIGVSEEDLPKLFTPFPGILVEGNVRGTGLGLSISKGIVELHGGKIWAESDGPGKGTTITFTLPFNE